MHRIDSTDNVATLPAPLAPGTPGYFKTGTTVRRDWLNTTQEELCNAAEIAGPLDKSDNTQVAKAIQAAVIGGAISVGAATTLHQVAVAVSENCGAFGALAFVGASRDSTVDGDRGAVLAGDFCAVGDNTSECAVLGARNSTVAEGFGPTTTKRSVIAGGDSHEIYGSDSFIGGGQICEVSGDRSAAIASESTTVSGDRSAAIACGNVTAVTVTGNGAAAIAAGQAFGATVSGDGAAAIAADGVTVAGTRAVALGCFSTEVAKAASAAIGCTHSKLPTGGNSSVVMLASSKFDASAAVSAPAFSVCGGYNNILNPYVNASWRLESNGGFMRSDNAHTTSGLDYAEFFQNADPTPHEPGQLLARAGRSARLARRGDRLLGVFSVSPTVIGGDDSLGWQGQWQRDEWGGFVWQELDGVRSRVRSPAWDATRQHAPRSTRPKEHTPVGLVGQLRVRVDATVQVDDEVVAGDVPGIGTRGSWVGRGAQVEVMAIEVPFDADRGYAIALCLVR